MNTTRNFLILTGVVVALGSTSNVRADFLFGEPVKCGAATTGNDDIDCFSSDGLEMYIDSPRSGGQGAFDLWVLKRASVDDDWGTAVNLGPAVNSSQDDWLSSISTDGLALYFCSNRLGGQGGSDIYMSTRASKNAPWGPPVNLEPPVNSASMDWIPWISSNSLELYLASNRPGGYGGFDLYVARRAATNDPWGEAVNLGPIVNSPYDESDPSFSPDGLLLFFSDYFETSGRPSGQGGPDMWMARRVSLSDPWQTPVNLGPRVNAPNPQTFPRLSPDGRTMYFWGFHNGAMDAWQAPIIPLVDFNGDEKVDLQDLLRLIESWGKEDPSVDMGPMPWGDGKVDEKDLEILMGYWQQEVLPVNLIAYWKLDEAEGIIAADEVGTHNGTLVGNPIWQPAGGKTKGALQFDGVDDCVSTPFVLDPSKGPFSVFAWVKGGAPGQVVLSQEKGADWLMADASKGRLMTTLSQPSNRKVSAGPLVSEVTIADAQWHRVGLVWNGSERILYIDDIEVARDSQTGLVASGGGLYIGAGSALTPGTFWKGLIDDVRIYDQAVKP